MSQVTATFGKTIKVFLRERSVLFWTIAWPIIWVLIGSFSFTGDIPKDMIPHVRGSITISMTVFALTIAGMANLPGSIARDRENGLLAKLMSMPVSPWKDFSGRILGLAVFSCLATALVVCAGFACRARFSGSVATVLQSIGFLLLALFASAGIGLLIGTFIKHVQGTIMTGVGISVVMSSISGLFVPYNSLPSLLQHFTRIYPVSSANSSIIYLLVGEELAGYNPLNTGQVALTIVLSLLLFIVGLILYSQFCWRKN